MSEPASVPDNAPPQPTLRARHALLKRLADVVSLPASRVNAFERAVTGDLLVDMLRLATPEDRMRVAQRLAPLADLPNSITRLLLRDAPEIAAVLIETCPALSDSDLLSCALDASPDHRWLIAGRREVPEVVVEAVVRAAEPANVERLLRNMTAHFSQPALEDATALSRTHRELVPHLLRRPELRPSGAYVMFWWAGPEERRTVLQRFAVSREPLQEVSEDVFPMAAAEGWGDPVSRKALQFIERRQRNRAAVEKSPFESLEHAVAVAGQSGVTRETAAEIAYLAGIKPLTGAKILGDVGGEPLAILCKATGMGREDLLALWRSTRRPETGLDGAIHPDLARVQTTFDMLAVDRAQTVLRYWNWSLSSALTPALMKAIREGDMEALDEYSAPERAAMLALAEDFGR
jgi:uncharacterized protein (DUF2336 family)